MHIQLALFDIDTEIRNHHLGTLDKPNAAPFPLANPARYRC